MNRWTNQFLHSFERKLVQMNCNFIVDPANGNGFGVRSLKGGGVYRVYMHSTASFVGASHTTTIIDGISGGTSSLKVGMVVSGSGVVVGSTIVAIQSSSAITLSVATTSSVGSLTVSYTAVGAPGLPSAGGLAAGLIYVVFQDNYNAYLGGNVGFVSPVSGTPISISTGSGLTIGAAYVIVSVGTSTTANWNAMGLPLGIIPNVGATFIATATGSGTGTGVVESSTNSGIMSVEAIGDGNQTIVSHGPSVLGQGAGSYLVAQCLNTSGAATAPTTGSVVGMSFWMSNSVITQQGQ